MVTPLRPSLRTRRTVLISKTVGGPRWTVSLVPSIAFRALRSIVRPAGKRVRLINVCSEVRLMAHKQLRSIHFNGMPKQAMPK